MTWTLFEDIKLIRLREKTSLDWARIAKHFPGKTKVSCERHYNSHLCEPKEANKLKLPPIQDTPQRKKQPIRRLKKLLYRTEVYRN